MNTIYNYWLKSTIELKEVINNILIKSKTNNLSKKELDVIKKILQTNMIIEKKENIEYTKKADIVQSTMDIHVTNKCNLECEFCCSEASPAFDIEERFNNKTIYKIIDYINNNNINHVRISGGEPLIYKEWYDVINIISKNTNAKISLLTNGLLLNKNSISNLNGKINDITISVENIFENKDQQTIILKKYYQKKLLLL